MEDTGRIGTPNVGLLARLRLRPSRRTYQLTWLTDPGGLPVDGVTNWANGFMPAMFQGTVLRPTEPRILNLEPPPHIRGKFQEQNLAFLQELNRRHLECILVNRSWKLESRAMN